MKKKIIIGVIVFMGMASIINILFGDRGHMPYEPNKKGFTSTTEKVQIHEPRDEYIFLQELLSCDEEHAVEIAEIFEDVTGKKLEDAELVPTEKKVKILKIVTSDKEYYLKISSVNVLKEIREGSMDGEVKYLMMY